MDTDETATRDTNVCSDTQHSSCPSRAGFSNNSLQLSHGGFRIMEASQITITYIILGFRKQDMNEDTTIQVPIMDKDK